MKNETWKSVGGYEGCYEVSSFGRVRRIGKGRGVVSGRILAQGEHKQGYLTINLYKGNIGRLFLAHRLVAAAFIGAIDGLEINHKDGDKQNNDVANLEIVGRQANIDHAVRTGLINNKGERNTQAKLTADDVRAIRSLYTFGGYRNGGLGYKAIAKRFGIEWESVRRIIKGTTWRHIATT